MRRISRKRIKDKKWITGGLIKSIKHKNKLYKNYLNNPNETNKTKYCKYKNILTKCLRKAQDTYYSSLIDENKKNVRAIWKIFGPIVNPNKVRKTKQITSLTINNNQITGEQQIADEFNNYFSNIANDISNELPVNTNYKKIPRK